MKGRPPGHFEYHTCLFAAQSTALMGECFKRLLKAVVEVPRSGRGRFCPMLFAAEREHGL